MNHRNGQWRERSSALPVVRPSAGLARPGKPPLACRNRRSLIVWNDGSMARRVKICSLHARCPHCQAVARLCPARRRGRLRQPVGNRQKGYIITLSLNVNMWLEHCGLAVRCTTPGQADGCSIPWRSSFVRFADPAALIQFQVFPPVLQETRVRFPRLIQGIGSNNVIIFV